MSTDRGGTRVRAAKLALKQTPQPRRYKVPTLEAAPPPTRTPPLTGGPRSLPRRTAPEQVDPFKLAVDRALAPDTTLGEAVRESAASGGYLGVRQAVRDWKNAARGFPTGVAQIAEAGYHDVGAVAHGHVPKHLVRDVLVPTAEGIYEDTRHPRRHPGNFILNAFALASAGAGTAARAAAVRDAFFEGARTLKAGEGVIEAARAGRASYKAGKPVARKVLPRRVFRVGDAEVSIPAAGSRSGRALEKLADASRPVTSKTGLVKTETERAGSELGVSTRIRLNITRATADALRKVGRKLNDAQEYALRIVAEGATPSERMEHHINLASADSRPEHVIYHGIHADLNRQAAKYIAIDAEGRPQIAPEAPKALHQAWDLFQRAGDQREDMLKELQRLQDEQIANRVHAPARVVKGARFKTYESQIQNALDASPVRQQLFDAIDKTISDPVQANAEKQLFDSLVRSHAQRVVEDPQAVDELLSHLQGVVTHTGEELPPEGALTQASWSHDEAQPTPHFGKATNEDIGGGNLQAAAIGVKMMAEQGQDVEGLIPVFAERFGVNEDELRAALEDPKLQATYDRVHSNEPVWEQGHPEYDAARKDVVDSIFEETGLKPELEQRGGALDAGSPYGIKGAIEFTKQHQAIIHLTQAADVTTFVHELAHFIRQYGLEPSLEKRVARWAGARRVNGEYVWDTAAEEKFARSVESYVRGGDGPPGLKQAFRSLAPVFRDIYDHADLPDVPPHVAQAFDRLFGFKKVPGGRIFGHEDVGVGVAYAPSWRGMPIKVSEPQKAMAVYFRRAQELFSGGGKRAISAGPDDVALNKEYHGSLLLSGYFTRDVIGPKVEKAIIANRMSAAHIARKVLVQAGEDLPKDVSYIAVKVDPSKPVGEVAGNDELVKLWEKMQQVDATGEKLSAKAINDVDFNLVEAARQDVFPAQIDGRDVRDVAAEIMQTQEPIDNIVWVPREFIDRSGLLYVPKSAQLARAGLNAKAYKVVKGAGVTWDAINDLQKAMILYFNPAYVPVNLTGNLVMNAMQQGVFMPVNLWRSVLMHREMDVLDRVTIDNVMGHGLTAALTLRTTLGQATQATLGHWINLAVDLVPRRAAFLHEARREGYKTLDSLKPLLEGARSGDEAAVNTLESIARRANDAIVDYERMSPLEREVLARWVFFYPWIKGASRYAVRFIADHPLQAAGLAMAYEHAQAAAQEKLGDRPVANSMEFPVSTESVGLKIPGVADVGLDQLVGKHDWRNPQGNPMVVGLRQALTQTTPLELLQTGIAFASGRSPAAAGGLVQSLTPVPYAIGVGLYGYDPFKHKEVRPGAQAILDQLGPSQSPLSDRIHLLNMSESERRDYQAHAIHPRTREQEWWRTFGGSLAPAPYNPEIGQARAQQEQLATKPLFERREFQLKQDSEKAGMGDVPPEVLDDLKWKTELDHAIHKGMKPHERAVAAAKLFDQRYGTDFEKSVIPELRNEGDAEKLYEQLRGKFYPAYAQWHRRINKTLGRAAEAEPVSG